MGTDSWQVFDRFQICISGSDIDQPANPIFKSLAVSLSIQIKRLNFSGGPVYQNTLRDRGAIRQLRADFQIQIPKIGRALGNNKSVTHHPNPGSII
jgi:hypothetical protein